MKSPKNEGFDENAFEEIRGAMHQLEPRNRSKNLLNSVDKSILVGENRYSSVVSNKVNEALLDEYVNNLINSDFKSPNKILENKQSERPTGADGNPSKYNHEMRIINNSRKLKQEYIIKILKLKVMKLLNSTQRVHNL